jgi:hypothetical protein
MDNMMMNPKMMGLLGLAQGLLQSSGASPRQITMGEALGNGLQGGMQGMQQGIDMQMRNQHMQAIQNEAQMKQNKLLRDLEARDRLSSIVGGLGPNANPGSISSAIMASGDVDLLPYAAQFRSAMPKVKTTAKVMKDGQAFIQPIYDTGEFGELSGLPAAEKLMQINRGGQVDLANPYSGEAQKSLPISISPVEQARLAQSERHFGASHGLAQQNAQFQRQQALKPQYKDGYWVTPPNSQNPEGLLSPTALSTAPKGSAAEKTKMAEKVKSTLGEDTEQLIQKATGSGIGAVRDAAASVIGITTDPAKANATLKLRAATLAGSMPRFEGPQSDADREYYLEMAGNLANPARTTEEKLMALKELRRIHGLADNNGVVDLGRSSNKNSADGWGDLR